MFIFVEAMQTQPRINKITLELVLEFYVKKINVRRILPIKFKAVLNITLWHQVLSQSKTKFTILKVNLPSTIVFKSSGAMM